MNNPDILHRIARITRRIHPPGTMRLLRLIHDPDSRRQRHIEIIMEYDSKLMIRVSTASYIEWCLFFFGYYEPDVALLIKRICLPDFVAVDVGANIGCFTLLMASLAHQGKVVAIEPHPALYQRLVGNVDLNHLTNVRPMQCALSDTGGEQVLFSPEADAPNHGVSSFYSRNVGARHTEIPVVVRTLDELVRDENFDRLDFVKIDTEGNERRVLLGAKESLRKHRPFVLFEYDQRTWNYDASDFQSVRRFLEELGYSLHTIERGHLGRAVMECPSRSTNLVAVPSGAR